MHRFFRSFLVVFVITAISFVPAQTTPQADFCGIKNTAFKDGEVVVMKVYYRSVGYIGAGEATFSTRLERYNGKPVYHFVGEGRTYSFFDNFFKVRDRYESYVDTATMLPVKFIRNVDEGGHKRYNNVTFNQTANTAVSTKGVYKITDCMQDVVSAMYYARNIDFNKHKPGDKIPFDMYLDDEIFHLYIRYMGKEKIKTKYGKFNAIKIKPLLVKGTIFEGGEKMNAWISDDQNRLLLRVESPISVGSVVVDMHQYRGLRYPLTSLLSVR
ncbi:MAG TPA: DUF3108 domain-containing protein [Ferruginibacter sp.]|nr:DUF3108 domain-containing protein [Ferruginibacter sp.]HRE62166.1 DUF3108 domain-containing protein [Ferruginibacter sp.]